MTEQKDFRIGDAEISLKDKYVRSSILPQGSRELSRNIKIQGNVIIEGGVFGNRIDINGGEVEFQSAVFANSELHIDGELIGKLTFKKAVACGDTVASLISTGRVVFWSDINAPRVRLKNCYIGGSVFAQEVYLENCVVLGGVFATKQATISNSIIGTFYSASTELSGICYLLYPTCFSTEPIISLPDTQLFNITLSNLGALYKGDPEMGNSGKIKIDLENDHQKTTLVSKDDVTIVVNSYSVSDKVLVADLVNMDALENHFLIGAGSLGSQILKNYSLVKADGSKSQDLDVDSIADFFFNILYGRIAIKDLSGDVDFSEIKKTLM